MPLQIDFDSIWNINYKRFKTIYEYEYHYLVIKSKIILIVFKIALFFRSQMMMVIWLRKERYIEKIRL